MKKLIMVVSLFMYLFTVGLVLAQLEQIIAVASLKNAENSQISDRAAHAPYYLIFTAQGKLLEVISNPFRDTARSAGPKVAGFLASRNVTVVVAGAFGYKMTKALEARGIEHYERTGIVNEALENLETISQKGK
jgi:predicted Fe-Mo cluster-binding NifX family protein